MVVGLRRRCTRRPQHMHVKRGQSRGAPPYAISLPFPASFNGDEGLLVGRKTCGLLSFCTTPASSLVSFRDSCPVLSKAGRWHYAKKASVERKD